MVMMRAGMRYARSLIWMSLAVLLLATAGGGVAVAASATPAPVASPATTASPSSSGGVLSDIGNTLSSAASSVGSYVSSKASDVVKAFDNSTVGSVLQRSFVGSEKSFTQTSVKLNPAASMVDKVVNGFHSRTQAWVKGITNVAKELFWFLAGMEVTWGGIRMLMKQSAMEEWVGEILNQTLFIGFFWALVLHGASWTEVIVDSFRQAGNIAEGLPTSAHALGPGDMIITAVQIVHQMWTAMSVIEWGTDISLAFLGFAALVSLGITSAWMVVTLVESYIIMSANILMLGFGGSRWTSEHALKAVNYAIAVGMKLFVLELVTGVEMQYLATYVSKPPSTLQGNMEMSLVTIVIGMVTIIIPHIVKGMVAGTSFSTGAALFGATSAVGGMAAGTAAAPFAGLAKGGEAAKSAFSKAGGGWTGGVAAILAAPVGAVAGVGSSLAKTGSTFHSRLSGARPGGGGGGNKGGGNKGRGGGGSGSGSGSGSGGGGGSGSGSGGSGSGSGGGGGGNKPKSRPPGRGTPPPRT